MALERARAEDTPFPPPDISSPRSNFANLSFIISISVTPYVIIRVFIYNGNKLLDKEKRFTPACCLSDLFPGRVRGEIIGRLLSTGLSTKLSEFWLSGVLDSTIWESPFSTTMVWDCCCFVEDESNILLKLNDLEALSLRSNAATMVRQRSLVFLPRKLNPFIPLKSSWSKDDTTLRFLLKA